MVTTAGLDNLALMLESIIGYANILFGGTLAYLVYKFIKPDGAEPAAEKEKKPGWLENMWHHTKTQGDVIGKIPTEARKEHNLERRESSTAINEMINEKKVLQQIVEVEASVQQVNAVAAGAPGVANQFKDFDEAYKALIDTLKDEGNNQRKHYKAIQKLMTEQQGMPGAVKGKLLTQMETLSNQVLAKYAKVQEKIRQINVQIALMKRPANKVDAALLDPIKASVEALLVDMKKQEEAANKASLGLVALVTSQKNYRTAPKAE